MSISFNQTCLNKAMLPNYTFIHIYNWFIGLMGRVFANGPGDMGSIPGCIISKTLKMVLDTSLLNTQQYKVRIKGKVEQIRERSSAFSYTSVQLLLKKEPSGCSRLRSPTLLYNIYICVCVCVCVCVSVVEQQSFIKACLIKK